MVNGIHETSMGFRMAIVLFYLFVVLLSLARYGFAILYGWLGWVEISVKLLYVNCLYLTLVVNCKIIYSV